ncbi:hypothetical protein PVAND_013308 [Polypedilum vanderplanki]|uniref:Uncharacterized protein n=1 Tax=Polypedilum vanderplanki TaxID=319348 RepID=A0A9J6CR54_POLVA|nr:hypothetical protein PVAND_013308 [Polypedilum vanderplanki]
MEQSKNINEYEILLQEKEKELEKVKTDLKQMEDDKKYEAWRASCFQSQVNFLKRQSDGLKIEYANYITQLMKTKEELIKVTQKSMEQTYSSLRQKDVLQNDKKLIKNLEKYIGEKLEYINFLHMILERNEILQEVKQEYKEFEERRKALKTLKAGLKSSHNLNHSDNQADSAVNNEQDCRSDEEFFESSESQDESLA